MKRIVLFFLAFLISCKTQQDKTQELVNTSITPTQTNEVKLKNLYNMLLEVHDSTAATMFLSIAIEESGWELNSKLAKNCNNFFGFKGNREYFCFTTPQECVRFTKLWYMLTPKLKDEDVSLYLASRNYNPDITYGDRIQQRIRYIQNQILK